MKAVIIAVLGFNSLTLSAPSSIERRQSALYKATDKYAFRITLEQFIDNRNKKAGPKDLDWNSNGCSYSPDNPLGFDFKESCYRHDFGYRNFKAQQRFSNSVKAHIDSTFKKDMMRQCAKEKFTTLCEEFAKIYYDAVTVFGKKREADMLDAGMAEERQVKE